MCTLYYEFWFQLPTKLGKVYDVDLEGTLYVKFPSLGEYLLSPSCCVKQYNPPKIQFDDEGKMTDDDMKICFMKIQ